MNDASRPLPADAPLTFLAGGGEMGERIRRFDWARTSLGAPESWPQSLRSAISFLLPSRAQIVLFWGPELLTFYNDGYRPVLGAKHPHVLGLPVWQTWEELWETRLKSLIMGVVETGQAYWATDAPFIMLRFGYPEETYFDVSYDPVRDESGTVAGVLCIVNETTPRVLAARRMRTLRELGARASEVARSVDEACSAAADTLGGNTLDVPFSAIYLLDQTEQAARLAAMSGLDSDSKLCPPSVPLGAERDDATTWPFRSARDTGQAQTITDLEHQAGTIRGVAWPEAVHTALVLPLRAPGQEALAGFLLAGVSPRRALDDSYRDFFELVAAQVAAGIASARAYEQEKQRAEALAQLDQAKTVFFSNVSHEFRTPLTLLLGPVEEMLKSPTAALDPTAKSQLQTIERNALRLLRLVNSLLDFARIESGRVSASFEPTDLSVHTAEIASAFQSACDRAGLALKVSCAPLPQPVYVDRSMWEKIVLNLLSNAFKFTFHGGIEVHVAAADDAAILEVQDSGIGIRGEELPKIFERFQRIENVVSRTHEGSGIGLSLVQDLVKLHGGSIDVRSKLDEGTAFTVRIPFGTTHLPREQVSEHGSRAAMKTAARPYVEEAIRWLPDDLLVSGAREIDGAEAEGVDLPRADGLTLPRVLVADDNADMRQYIARLLQSRYEVELVGDGEAALVAARARLPDLILTDVMMPRLNGFELIRDLRADPALQSVPVIMLSARAGEESHVEGLDAGADDYLVKPFSARELVARASAHIKIARTRRDAGREIQQRGEQFKTLLDTAPLGVYLVDADFRIREVNPIAMPVFGEWPGGVLGRDFVEVIRRLWSADYADEVTGIFRHTLQTGESHFEPERAERRIDRNSTEYYEWRVDRIQLPEGRYGVVCYFRDISDRKRAEQALRTSEATLRAFYDNAPMCMGVVEPTEDGDVLHIDDNPLSCRFFGVAPGAMQNRRALADLDADPNVVRTWLEHYSESRQSGMPVRFEHRLNSAQGTRWLAATVCPIGPGPTGRDRFCYVAEDVTERMHASERLREADRRKDEFLATLAHELRNPLAPIRNGLQVMKLAGTDNPAVEQARTMMERQLVQMVHLIDDLMDISRISRGRIELRKERLELSRILQQAIETSMPIIEANRHELCVQSRTDPVHVEGDATRLAQVFANLLNNAAKYTEPGGKIWLSVHASTNDVLVRVRDSGIGIPAHMLPMIFDMFTQGHRSIDKAQGGLGIGLSLVKNLVAMHGGEVQARSEGAGRGSDFTVCLPRLPAMQTAHTSQDQLRTPLPRKRVLIVDDNRDAANSLATVLELLGNATRTAYEGREALDIAPAFHPDVVLLDLGMPEMDGYETCRRIRREPWGSDTIVVAVTGWGQEQDRIRARDAGFNHHLVKPVEPMKVLELMASH